MSVFRAGVWPLAAAIALMSSPASAATYWWNSVTTGTWTNGTLWSDAATGGTAGTAPTNDTTTDVVVFNQTGTDGTVVSLLNQDQSIGGITVNNTGATTIRSSTSTPRTFTLGAGGITLNSSAGAFTIGATGSMANVALAGSQTWTNNSSSLFTVNGGITSGVSGTQTLTLAGSGSSRFAGILGNGSGILAVRKIDSGTASLAAANTYTGATTVEAGRLTVAQTGTFFSPSISIAAGATFEFNNSGALAYVSSGTANRYVISGSGTFLKTGAGTLDTGNAVGGTVIQLSPGALLDIQGGIWNGGRNQNTLWASNQASMNIAAGATFLPWNGNPVVIDALTGAGTVGGSNNGIPGTGMTIGVAGGSGTFSGIISNLNNNFANADGNITKTGSGTQVFSGNNTYTGTTTVSGGTLRVTTNTGLGFGGQMKLTNGVGSTTVTSTATVDLAGVTVSEPITLNTGVLINSNTTTASVISDGLAAIRFTNGGSGYIVTGTITTGTAALTITGGGGSGATATGTFTSGTLVGITLTNAGTGYTSAPTISLPGAGSGAVVTAGISSFTLVGSNNQIGGAGNLTIAAAIGSTGGFSKIGGGTLTLSGSNSYTGATSISAGTLAFDRIAALATTSGVTIAPGATLAYTGAADTFTRNITVSSGTGTVRNTGAGTLALSGTLTKNGSVLRFNTGTFTVSGLITGASANSDLVVDAATVTLTNSNNDYNGPTFVQNGGTLILGENNVISSLSAVTVDASTLTVGGFRDTIQSLTTAGDSTINLTASGTTSGSLSMGNLTLGGGTDTLGLTMTSPTAGRYTLFTYTGTRSGTFDTVSGLNSNYNVVYGAASNSSIDLQMKASLGTVSATTANARIIVGGSTAITYTVANTSPTNAATLYFQSGSNSLTVTGSSSGIALANQTSSPVSGLVFTSGTVGLGQAGSFTVTDPDAITTSGNGSVSVDVLNHSLASFAPSNTASQTLSFGTYDTTTGGWSGGSDGTLAFALFNIASDGFTNAQTAGLDLYDWTFSGDAVFSSGLSQFTNLAAGTSNPFSASVISPGSLAAGTYTGTYTLKFRDQNLPGAINTRDLSLTMNVIVVPEPGALVLAALGAAAAALVARRRR